MFSRRRYRLPKRLVVLGRCKLGQEAGRLLPLCTLSKRGEGSNMARISPATRPFSHVVCRNTWFLHTLSEARLIASVGVIHRSTERRLLL